MHEWRTIVGVRSEVLQTHSVSLAYRRHHFRQSTGEMEGEMPQDLVPDTYNRLRGEIAQALTSGKQRAWRAVEQEKLETYRQIGCLLDEHLLSHRDRAGYGEQLLAQLARDLEVNQQRLYEMLKFYRLFPMDRTSGKLGWSHYLALTALPTEGERNRYGAEAERLGWSVRELKSQIRARTLVPPGEQPDEREADARDTEVTLPALRGQLFTYRLVGSPSAQQPRLDLGFGIHIARPLTGLDAPRAGMVVGVSRSTGDGISGSTYRFHETGGRQVAFHTYCASVTNVIDGDTLAAEIDCGFGVWTQQKVRLRGIDTPELQTPEGVRARGFVRTALETASTVVLTTTKPDKYDRYLADVFYAAGDLDPQEVADSGVYLNRELLAKGLAQRFSDSH